MRAPGPSPRLPPAQSPTSELMSGLSEMGAPLASEASGAASAEDPAEAQAASGGGGPGDAPVEITAAASNGGCLEPEASSAGKLAELKGSDEPSSVE